MDNNVNIVHSFFKCHQYRRTAVLGQPSEKSSKPCGSKDTHNLLDSQVDNNVNIVVPRVSLSVTSSPVVRERGA